MNEPCELLPWDSAFFGRRIGRVCGARLDEASARAALDWCRRERIACLYFLADAGDPETAAAAEAAGFRMVDVRLTCVCRLRGPVVPADLPPDFAVRPAGPEDLPALEAIAAAAHTDSRFYFDRRFPRADAARLYRVWLRRGLEDPAGVALALVGPQGPGGYITCEVEAGGRAGRVGLGGLAPELRGRGLGLPLYREALRWFAGRGVSEVRYVTQARNVQAQRVIQRLGFLTESVGVWYHRWADADAVGAAAA
jgi:dTDP-4-amino-4,6-dideoxy-D-galactose acyltransferase